MDTVERWKKTRLVGHLKTECVTKLDQFQDRSMDAETKKIVSDKCEESEYASELETPVAESEEKPCEEGATIYEKVKIKCIPEIESNVGILNLEI